MGVSAAVLALLAHLGGQQRQEDELLFEAQSVYAAFACEGDRLTGDELFDLYSTHKLGMCMGKAVYQCVVCGGSFCICHIQESSDILVPAENSWDDSQIAAVCLDCAREGKTREEIEELDRTWQSRLPDRLKHASDVPMIARGRLVLPK